MQTFLFLTELSLSAEIIIGVFLFLFLALLVYYGLTTLELIYVMRFKKPYFAHFPFFLKKLKPNELAVLKSQFRFFQRLSRQQQRHFEHRVSCFVKDKAFIGRADLVVTDDMRILISATAVMLTFGFRDFYIRLINKIFIYPEAFYSTQNQTYHKGEFNPRLKALVLSWSDFVNGFDIKDDNINLGIHEFAHAIHLNSLKAHDISSILFSDSFKGLMALIEEDESLRNKLLDSEYFRAYAYTNPYEFVAVIIENFIETPQELKTHFPRIYEKTKQMLNFRFAGY